MKWTKKLGNFMQRVITLDTCAYNQDTDAVIGLRVRDRNGYVSQLREEGWGCWWVEVCCWRWALRLSVEYVGDGRWEQKEHVYVPGGHCLALWVPPNDTMNLTQRAIRQYPTLAAHIQAHATLMAQAWAKTEEE